MTRILETMRMYPPTIVNDRYCNEKAVINTEKGPITVEPGVSILWFTPYIHMNEEYFADPYKFDPDRWEGKESDITILYSPYNMYHITYHMYILLHMYIFLLMI